MTRALALLVAVLLVLGPSAAETAAEEGAFRYDQHTGKCRDSGGREGLNPGGSGDKLLRQAKAVAECVDFTKARANMTYLRLTGANLRGANLDGVMFYLGTFTDSDFRGANLDGTSGQVDYSRSDLRGASFLGADLTYNTFDGALLEGARFDDATRLPFSRVDAEARGMTFVPSRR